MENCPKCGFEREPEDTECPECGVIYEIYNFYLDRHGQKEEEEIICPSCGAEILKGLTSCPRCEALLVFDPISSPDEERLKKLKTYSYAQALLREREYIFEKISSEQELDSQIKYFLLYSLLCSACYGLFLGCFAGNWQILASLIKVPALLLGTLFICLPMLHVLNILFGIKLTFKQILAMLMASTFLMSMTLASMSPILLFFIILTSAKKFVSVLNVTMFGIAGLVGLRLLWKGMRYLTMRSWYHPKIHVVKAWYVIYVLIATQLAWILRPFVGEKGTFVLFREIEGNFYLAIYNIIRSSF